MYLSTMPGLSLSASAVIHVKKLFTKIKVSVELSCRVRLEKLEISQNRMEALISRPLTGNRPPQPSSNSPFTDNGLAVRKSSSELNLYFTGLRGEVMRSTAAYVARP